MAHDYYALGQSGDVDTTCGGSLHIVLDDGNIEDADVRFCVEEAIKLNDRAGELLGRILLRMSRTQRLKVANTHDGYALTLDERDEASLIRDMANLLVETDGKAEQ